MRKRRSIYLLLPALAAALAFSGCGSSDERIPPQDAQELNEELEVLEDQIDAEDCAGAEETLTTVFASANGLDSGDVDREVRNALDELLKNLEELVRDRCNELEEEETTTTEPTTTEPTTTTDEPTTTETTETTTTTTTDTTSPKPPDNGNNGNGPPGGSPPGQGGQPPSDGGVGPGEGDD